MTGKIHPTWLEVLADPVRLDVLVALSSAGSGSVSEIAQCCHAGERTVRRHLDALAALGLARQSLVGSGGERPGRPPTRFIIDERVRGRVMALFALVRQPLAPSSIRAPENAPGR